MGSASTIWVGTYEECHAARQLYLDGGVLLVESYGHA